MLKYIVINVLINKCESLYKIRIIKLNEYNTQAKKKINLYLKRASEDLKLIWVLIATSFFSFNIFLILPSTLCNGLLKESFRPG